MNQTMLWRINAGMALVAVAITLWFASLCLSGWRDPSGRLPSIDLQVRPIGSHPFQQPSEAYTAVKEVLLGLDRPPPTLTLPDLSKVLTFTGSNARPDADPERRTYHLLLKGDSASHAVEPSIPAYLTYDTSQKPARYVWSAENRPTRLWLEVKGDDGELAIKVRMRGVDEQLVTGPVERAEFTLKERPQSNRRGEQWMLGGFRVDGTLLARQRARWYGEDLFLQDRGGEEYAHLADKQRIDFGEGEESYSRWVGPDECLMWDGTRWQQADLLSGSSYDKELLCVKQIADKVMTFVLWDVGGRRKVTLNVIRSNEMWQPQALEKEFRLVGARTRSQSIVEIRGVRQTLRPYDWLFYSDGEWRKLSTAEEIDDFVDRRLVGPLFIFEGLESDEGVQKIRGVLYNSSRGGKHEMKVGAQQEQRSMHRQQPVPEAGRNTTPAVPQNLPTGRGREEASERVGMRGSIPFNQSEDEPSERE